MTDLMTPPSSQSYDKSFDSSEDELVLIKAEKYLYPSPSPAPNSFNILDSQLTSQQEQKEEQKIKTKPKRKPKLKYRPPNGTVLDTSTYDSEVPIFDQDDDIDYEDVGFLHYALKYSKKVAIVTGAGISVASGIPDFRSSNGLFQGLKSSTSAGSNGKALFDSNVYRDNESTAKFHAMINQLHKMTSESKATNFHHLMDKISEEGRLLRHYTQNIDCLEYQLPNLQTSVPIRANPPYPPTIQLHGTIKYMYCAKCRWNTEIQPEIFDGEEVPVCPECLELDEVRRLAGKRSQGVGCLRPRIVLYNEFHPDGEHIGKVSTIDLKSKPDCLIIAGTSLKIPGVRRLVKELAKSVHANRGCVIWVNRDEPSMSIVDYIDYLDLIVTGDCQDIPSIIENYDRSIQPKKRARKSTKKTDENGLIIESKVTKDSKEKAPKKRVKKEDDKLIQMRLEQLVTKINDAK